MRNTISLCRNLSYSNSSLSFLSYPLSSFLFVTSQLFYLITDLYKEGNAKEMRKWAYEIHSSFLVPYAVSKFISFLNFSLLFLAKKKKKLIIIIIIVNLVWILIRNFFSLPVSAVEIKQRGRKRRQGDWRSSIKRIGQRRNFTKGR